MVEKLPFATSRPFDYSPHGAPRQPPQESRTFPDPKKVTRERETNRQFARYRRRGFTRQEVARSLAVGGT